MRSLPEAYSLHDLEGELAYSEKINTLSHTECRHYQVPIPTQAEGLQQLITEKNPLSKSTWKVIFF